jgi:hypothetical protein
MIENKKILICGDSFSADWTVKYPNGFGWPNLLAQKYEVTNLAQAGCCEYKIYNQLTSQNLEKYDIVLISHTSPNRLFVETHPVHANDLLHKDCDLIYSDIKEHCNNNPKLKSIIDFYNLYFSQEYAQFTHNLICEKIYHYTKHHSGKVIHMTNMYWDGLYDFPDLIKFNISKMNHGLFNHYNDRANIKVFLTIDSVIQGKKNSSFISKIIECINNMMPNFNK